MSKSESIAFLAVVALLQVICGLITPTEAANNCSTIVCQNGGLCNIITASPPCICPPPYIPPYCAEAADYCKALQPHMGINELPVCQNGGNCTVIFTDPYFNCACLPGYTGLRCNATITTSTMQTVYARTNQIPSSGFSTGAVAGTAVGSAIAAAVVLIGMATNI